MNVTLRTEIAQAKIARASDRLREFPRLLSELCPETPVLDLMDKYNQGAPAAEVLPLLIDAERHLNALYEPSDAKTLAGNQDKLWPVVNGVRDIVNGLQTLERLGNTPATAQTPPASQFEDKAGRITSSGIWIPR